MEPVPIGASPLLNDRDSGTGFGSRLATNVLGKDCLEALHAIMAGPAVAGGPALYHFRRVKWCVFAMWGLVLIRLLLVFPSDALPLALEVVASLLGTFAVRKDPTLGSFTKRIQAMFAGVAGQGADGTEGEGALAAEAPPAPLEVERVEPCRFFFPFVCVCSFVAVSGVIHALFLGSVSCSNTGVCFGPVAVLCATALYIVTSLIGWEVVGLMLRPHSNAEYAEASVAAANRGHAVHIRSSSSGHDNRPAGRQRNHQSRLLNSDTSGGAVAPSAPPLAANVQSMVPLPRPPGNQEGAASSVAGPSAGAGASTIIEAAAIAEATVAAEAVAASEATIATEAAAAADDNEAAAATEATAATGTAAATEASAAIEASAATEATAPAEAAVAAEAAVTTEAAVPTEAAVATEAAADTEAAVVAEAGVITEAAAPAEAAVATEATASTEAAIAVVPAAADDAAVEPEADVAQDVVEDASLRKRMFSGACGGTGEGRIDIARLPSEAPGTGEATDSQSTAIDATVEAERFAADVAPRLAGLAEASSPSEERSPVAAEEVASDSALEPQAVHGDPAAGGVELMIRFPDGKRERQMFHRSDTVGAIYRFVDAKRAAGSSTPPLPYRLTSVHPRNAFEDHDATLEEAGIEHQIVLHVETKGP